MRRLAASFVTSFVFFSQSVPAAPPPRRLFSNHIENQICESRLLKAFSGAPSGLEDPKESLVRELCFSLYWKNENQNWAAWMLGVMLRKGNLGLDQDLRKAMYFYEKAAAEGYLPAIWDTAICYLEGKKDYKGFEVVADNLRACEYLALSVRENMIHADKGLSTEDARRMNEAAKSLQATHCK